MRRILSVVLVAMFALSWTTGFASRSSLPPCCKAHHCSMKKQCGMSTAPAVSAEKIYTVLCNVPEVTPQHISFDVTQAAARHLPLAPLGDIDHPPRLLLV